MQRRLGMAVLASLVGLGFAASAQAMDRSGMYLGVTGGYTHPTGEAEVNDVRIEDVDFPDTNLTLDDGWEAMVAVGWNINSFRLEGELGYRGNDIDTIEVANPAYTADVDYNGIYTFMVNGYYDLPLGDTFGLYVGGGVGVGVFPIDADYTGPGVTGSADGALASVCYQGMAGVTVNLSKRVHLNVGYRIFSAVESSVETDNFEGKWSLPVFHAAEAGLRFDL